MHKKYPLISVIVITYNESKSITKCLSRIRSQLYPQNKIEIILVDDDSTDNTIELAKKYNVKIFRSGFKNCERAKSIGIKKSKGELILFIDADVYICSNNYIKKTVDLFFLYPKIVAAQSIRWQYSKNDNIINRYCNLFGINNPLVLFLGKRGTLMAIEKKWFNKSVVINNSSYYCITKFNVNNLPTVGSIGYMVKKKDILKTSWKPFFFHLDTAYELVENGKDQFALTTLPVKHDYVNSFIEYHKKAYRNIFLFYKYRYYRKYDYNINPIKLLISILLMLSVVYPLFQSFKGYIKKPDLAWFIHPILCITIPIVYSITALQWKYKNLFIRYEQK